MVKVFRLLRMGFSSMRLTQQPTTLLARRALLRAAAALIASQGWLPAWADSPTMPALTNVQTRGFSLQVPSSYYQQKSRARVSEYVRRHALRGGGLRRRTISECGSLPRQRSLAPH